MQGIYRISCSQDPRSYIGSSVDIERRWKDHKRQLNAGTHKNSKLQLDWDAYGDESFTFNILEETNELVAKEQKWLNEYTNSRYNISANAWNPMADPATAKKQQASLNKSGNRGNQKLSEISVMEIVNLAKKGMIVNEIAIKYKVGCGHIYNILNGNKWSAITGITASRINKRNKITEIEIQIIKDEIEKGNSYMAIGKLLGVDYTTIRSWSRKLNLRKPR